MGLHDHFARHHVDARRPDDGCCGDADDVPNDVDGVNDYDDVYDCTCGEVSDLSARVGRLHSLVALLPGVLDRHFDSDCSNMRTPVRSGRLAPGQLFNIFL